jgi:hypothetical protein
MTFSFVLLGLVVIGMANALSTTVASVVVSSSVQTVTPGEIFYLTVTVSTPVSINAVDIVVDYPEDKMELETIDTGPSVITLWTRAPYDENGKIYFQGGTYRRGFIGEHTIARVRMKARVAGEALISVPTVSLVAGDGRGSAVAVEEPADTRVSISDEVDTLVARANVSIVTDVDGNGVVDIKDVSAFMSAWFTRGQTFDFNGDGRMTFRDFSIVLADSFRGRRSE